MRLKRQVRVGDIIKIPLAEDVFGIAQVIAQPDRGFEFIIAYDVFIRDEETISFHELSNKEIILFAELAVGVNMLRKRKQWPVIGNMPISDKVVFPEYKVSTGKGWMITNWEGKNIRVADEKEVLKMQFKGSFSLAAIEGALRAYLGLEKPSISYERIMKKEPKG